MANLSAIKLPNGTTYNLKDNGALQLTGGSVTGPVSFGDSVSIDEATIGDLVVNGDASFTNNLQANTINGVTVGNNPKFTDTNTVTTATTTGSGNAVTAITASNGALTVTKGTTFLTSHQDISGKADKSATVSTVTYDSTNKKITKTINGTTSDVVTVATLKTALGSMPASDVYSWAKASSKPTYTASEVGALPSSTTYVSTITTTAGPHTAISNKSGAVSFRVPAAPEHVGIKFEYTTSGNNRAVQQDSSGNLYVVQKDTVPTSMAWSNITDKPSLKVGPLTTILNSNTNTTITFSTGLQVTAEVSTTGSDVSGEVIVTSGNSNLVNGSTTGSLRTVGSTAEDSLYTVGEYAFAEGYSTEASGDYSHAEGCLTVASDSYSHAEGTGTTAIGYASHAEGEGSVASGRNSHSQNRNTIARGYSQTAIGRYNVAQGSTSSLTTTDHVFIIGNGTGDTARSNALTVDWSGNVYAAGAIYTNTNLDSTGGTPLTAVQIVRW